MNLKDMFAPLKDQFLIRWEAIQESSLYNELKEKYENLTPIWQKTIIGSAIALVVIFFLSFPLGWLSTAGDSIESFEDKRQVTLNLLDVVQEIKNSPPAPPRLSANDLKTRIDKIISDAGFLPEQVKNLKEEPPEDTKKSRLIPNSISAAFVNVEVNKLNLKQIVDFEYQLNKISPIVKVMSLDMRANAEDNHYYNVNYMVASFNIQDGAPSEATTKEQPKTQNE